MARPVRGGAERFERLLRQIESHHTEVNPDYALERAAHYARKVAIRAALVEAGERYYGADEGSVDDMLTIMRRVLDQPSAASPVGRPAGARPLQEFLELHAPEPEVILSPWLAVGSRTLLHADAGVGKTQVALSVAAALADCRPAIGGLWLPTRPAKVLYVDGELTIGLLTRWLGWQQIRHTPICSSCRRPTWHDRAHR